MKQKLLEKQVFSIHMYESSAIQLLNKNYFISFKMLLNLFITMLLTLIPSGIKSSLIKFSYIHLCGLCSVVDE